MYNVRLFGIVTMNPPIQLIYSNKNGKKNKLLLLPRWCKVKGWSDDFLMSALMVAARLERKFHQIAHF
jgi:hypothetical protein